MKLTIDSTVLAEAAAWVSKAADKRPLHPVMGGIVMDAADGVLKLSAASTTTSSTETVPADVDAPGHALVSGDRLLAFATSFPKSKPVQVDVTEAGLNLQCGRSLFSLAVMDGAMYPDPPEFPGKVATVDGHAFADALERVRGAAGTDDSKPVHMAIRLIATDGVLAMYATDGYRMAECLIDWGGEDGAYTLKPEALASVTGAGEVTVFADDSIVGFEFGTRKTTALQVAGDYPNVQRVMNNYFPGDVPVTITLDTNEFIEGAGRAGLASGKGINGGKDSLRMTTTDAGMVIETTDDGVATGTEYVPATLEGAKEYTALMNPKFLNDVLRSIHVGTVRLGITEPGKPIMFTPEGSDSYRHIIMPVRETGGAK